MLCFEMPVALGSTESKLLAVISDEKDSVAWVNWSGAEVAPLYSHSTINYNPIIKTVFSITEAYSQR